MPPTSLSLYIYPSIYLSIYLSLYLSIFLSIYLYISDLGEALAHDAASALEPDGRVRLALRALLHIRLFGNV